MSSSTASRRPTSYCPQVEELEQRWTPAVVGAAPVAAPIAAPVLGPAFPTTLPAFPPPSVLNPTANSTSVGAVLLSDEITNVQVLRVPNTATLMTSRQLEPFQVIQPPVVIPLEQTPVYLNGGSAGGIRDMATVTSNATAPWQTDPRFQFASEDSGPVDEELATFALLSE